MSTPEEAQALPLKTSVVDFVHARLTRLWWFVVGAYVIVAVAQVLLELDMASHGFKAASVVLTFIGALLVVEQAVSTMRRYNADLASGIAFIGSSVAVLFLADGHMPRVLVAVVGLVAGAAVAVVAWALVNRLTGGSKNLPAWVGVALLSAGFVMQLGTALTT